MVRPRLGALACTTSRPNLFPTRFLSAVIYHVINFWLLPVKWYVRGDWEVTREQTVDLAVRRALPKAFFNAPKKALQAMPDYMILGSLSHREVADIRSRFLAMRRATARA